MKISEKARQDFEFYKDTELKTLGVSLGCETELDINGHSALKCFVAKDTHGKILPCSEPEELDSTLKGKASWNLQIKQWATDISEGLMLTQNELHEYCSNLPKWVFPSVVKQAESLSIKSIGFSPRFSTYKTIFKQWVPVGMDSFDPVI